MDGTVSLKTGPFPSRADTLLCLCFEDTLLKDKNFLLFDKKSNGTVKKKAEREEFKAKEGQILVVGTGSAYELLVVCGVGKSKEVTPAKIKNILASAFRHISSLKYRSVTLLSSSAFPKDPFETGKIISLAFYLANYHFDKYKNAKDREKTKRLEKLDLFLKDGRSTVGEIQKGIDLGRVITEGMYLTRNLVNEPASHVSPDVMAQNAMSIAKESRGKISVDIKNEAECRKLGMGAFLGVAQGSEKNPKFIILHYRPKRRPKQTVCLVGKTITFDSGGLSLKPADYMMDMKMDMAGGATVLGIFTVLSRMNEEIDKEVYGILPACENMPSGKALRPGDIVTALNGKTIEVLNTDAEGRLALADGLSYAEKFIKPDYLIDLATLTGACMVALGKEVTGMFGNDQALLTTFENICKTEGDEVWQLPLHKSYLKQMQNGITDLKNIGGGRYGGAITAALFLSEFVSKSKWIHLDIAGPAYNDEGVKGIIPKGATGWGVTSLVEWLRK